MSLPSTSAEPPVATSRRKPRRTSEPENFIPLRKTDLRELLLSDPALSELQRQQLAQLCRLLEAALHHEYHARLEELKDAYAPFDPDADTRGTTKVPPEDRDALAGEFFDRTMDLLDRANFQHLLHEHLTDALDEASVMGINLDVDFSVFQRLEIFARGSNIVSRRPPGLWHRLRGTRLEIPVYQRLVLLFRLRQHKRLTGPVVDTSTIYLKIFKDIPKSDLDMLLPGTQVRMSIYDRGKIIVPTLTGVALAVHKIVTIVLTGALVVALSSVYGLLALLGLVGGTIGYGIRSFFAYLNTKDKYHLSLTRSLYFQNLDNNAGVLFRLLDEAEEQEFREAILAYVLLWKNATREGWTLEQLDRAVEQFLLESSGIQVDFEIGDALEKLIAMKLVVPTAGARWRAVDLSPALANLDAAWDALYHSAAPLGEKRAPHFLPLSPAESDDWGPVL